LAARGGGGTSDHGVLALLEVRMYGARSEAQLLPKRELVFLPICMFVKCLFEKKKLVNASGRCNLQRVDGYLGNICFVRLATAGSQSEATPGSV